MTQTLMATRTRTATTEETRTKTTTTTGDVHCDSRPPTSLVSLRFFPEPRRGSDERGSSEIVPKKVALGETDRSATRTKHALHTVERIRRGDDVRVMISTDALEGRSRFPGSRATERSAFAARRNCVCPFFARDRFRRFRI
ncbi:hypothetical protein ACHAWF_002069, partial [Thalassiosira exigua]